MASSRYWTILSFIGKLDWFHVILRGASISDTCLRHRHALHGMTVSRGISHRNITIVSHQIEETRQCFRPLKSQYIQVWFVLRNCWLIIFHYYLIFIMNDNRWNRSLKIDWKLAYCMNILYNLLDTQLESANLCLN